jgi:hypothetical protein
MYVIKDQRVCREARSAQRATPTLAPNYPKTKQKAANYRLRRLLQKNRHGQVPGREDPVASRHVPYLGQAPKGETPAWKLLSERRRRQDQSSEASKAQASEASKGTNASKASIATKHTGGIHLKFMSLGEKTVGPIERSEKGTHKRAQQQDELRAKRATRPTASAVPDSAGTSRALESDRSALLSELFSGPL